MDGSPEKCRAQHAGQGKTEAASPRAPKEVLERDGDEEGAKVGGETGRFLDLARERLNNG